MTCWRRLALAACIGLTVWGAATVLHLPRSAATDEQVQQVNRWGQP